MGQSSKVRSANKVGTSRNRGGRKRRFVAVRCFFGQLDGASRQCVALAGGASSGRTSCFKWLFSCTFGCELRVEEPGSRHLAVWWTTPSHFSTSISPWTVATVHRLTCALTGELPMVTEMRSGGAASGDEGEVSLGIVSGMVCRGAVRKNGRINCASPTRSCERGAASEGSSLGPLSGPEGLMEGWFAFDPRKSGYQGTQKHKHHWWTNAHHTLVIKRRRTGAHRRDPTCRRDTDWKHSILRRCHQKACKDWEHRFPTPLFVRNESVRSERIWWVSATFSKSMTQTATHNVCASNTTG